MNASEQGFILISNNVEANNNESWWEEEKEEAFSTLKEGYCRKLMAKCLADIVGLVSGESTIIITVNIRMRKYWINLLDNKFARTKMRLK